MENHRRDPQIQSIFFHPTSLPSPTPLQPINQFNNHQISTPIPITTTQNNHSAVNSFPQTRNPFNMSHHSMADSLTKSTREKNLKRRHPLKTPKK